MRVRFPTWLNTVLLSCRLCKSRSLLEGFKLSDLSKCEGIMYGNNFANITVYYHRSRDTVARSFSCLRF